MLLLTKNEEFNKEMRKKTSVIKIVNWSYAEETKSVLSRLRDMMSWVVFLQIDWLFDYNIFQHWNNTWWQRWRERFMISRGICLIPNVVSILVSSALYLPLLSACHPHLFVLIQFDATPCLSATFKRTCKECFLKDVQRTLKGESFDLIFFERNMYENRRFWHFFLIKKKILYEFKVLQRGIAMDSL